MAERRMCAVIAFSPITARCAATMNVGAHIDRGLDVRQYRTDDWAAIDLIVIGTDDRTCVSRLVMGSVADQVLLTASCPVLAVRRPKHEFVVADALVTATPA